MSLFLDQGSAPALLGYGIGEMLEASYAGLEPYSTSDRPIEIELADCPDITPPPQVVLKYHLEAFRRTTSYGDSPPMDRRTQCYRPGSSVSDIPLAQYSMAAVN